MTAYATLADFSAGFEAAAPSAARALRIESALLAASRMIDRAVGYGFARDPATGTAIRVFDGPGTAILHVHGGIVSLTTVEVADDASLAYVALAAADWYTLPLTPQTGEPFDHVVMAEGCGRAAFPHGQRRVRLTGVFGADPIPSDVREATVALARQLYRADSTMPGGMIGPDEWSGGAGFERAARGWPDSAYRAVAHYRAKYAGCYV